MNEVMRMEIIATVPPPHEQKLLVDIATTPGLTQYRFNTGAKTPLSPKETLQKILEYIPKEKLWVDIKGRQLRVEAWAVPTFGDMVLNRDFEGDLPMEIMLRNGDRTMIVAKEGQKIFVSPRPRFLIGAGQSVNIIGNNFRVTGDYLTENDRLYIEAAKELGLNKYMISFFEKLSDISEVLAVDPDGHIRGKIESLPGLELIKSDCSWISDRVGLVAARDDLVINLRFNAKKIFDALKLIIKQDPNAIVASRLLTSLQRESEVSLGDLSDVYLMKEMGYRNFLLSDQLCSHEQAVQKAVSILKSFQENNV